MQVGGNFFSRSFPLMLDGVASTGAKIELRLRSIYFLGYHVPAVSKPSTAKKEPQHVVIDKSTAAKVNLSILVAIVLTSVGGAVYLRDIEHAVATANKTLEEVKAELTKHTGIVTKQSVQLFELEHRIDDHEKRLKALEKR